MILFGNLEHGRQIAHNVHVGFDPEVDHVISRVLNDELLGGVIYTNYTRRTVQVHMYGAGSWWANRVLLWAGFDFPFNHLKVERIIITVPSTNLRSLNVVNKLGFEPVTVIPEAVLGGDMEVLSMSREECPWLRLGKRYSAGLKEKAA